MAEAKKENNIELQNQLLKSEMYWNLSAGDRLRLMGVMAGALAVGVAAGGTIALSGTAATVEGTVAVMTPVLN
ncbi:hypothetical protein MKU92_003230 [Salmonella enterica]|nr:hypothetical protein [Salmonella enterica subsp. enterica]EDS4738531.1 hypothetical protein [Salmonella enterica subsp. enterica serovar Oranienburg]EIX6434276.1 hypothetical protein [Salmonella enterica]ELC6749308.1 hypothetical protein [Salmonella enterica]ELC6767809.1 hypothetical protein [Salmonella enterica]